MSSKNEDKKVKDFKIRGWQFKEVYKHRRGKNNVSYSGEVWHRPNMRSPIIRQYGYFDVRAKNLQELKDKLGGWEFSVHVKKLTMKDYQTDLLVAFTDKDKEAKGRLIIAMGILNNLGEIKIKYSQLTRAKIKKMNTQTAKKIMTRFYQSSYNESDLKKYKQ